MFKDRNDVLFMGKIIGVSLYGNLQVELDNETIKEFGIKEISFV
jgi:BirA family biotin operon repressor/biotin-[acetyl-CoA-carboxylase] ligase